jgi:Ca2+-binding RTX toxin-like protein
MATITGTESADTITGINDQADYIYGLGGNDEIHGLGYSDVIYGGAGADYMDGGDHFDWASYETSPMAVYASLADGGVGSDANGDIFVDIEGLIGSPFTDFLAGDEGHNSLSGRDGNDTLAGRGGYDTISGQVGDDVLQGDEGNDNLNGGVGADQLYGGTENDLLHGDEDNDYLSGESGNDYLYGDSGVDQLSGGIDADTLEGGEGADQIDGGDGIDLLSYRGSSLGVVINLTTGAASGGDATGDSFSNFENLEGSYLDDSLVGDINPNSLNGLLGNDFLDGRGGNDSLFGDWAMTGLKVATETISSLAETVGIILPAAKVPMSCEAKSAMIRSSVMLEQISWTEVLARIKLTIRLPRHLSVSIWLLGPA